MESLFTDEDKSSFLFDSATDPDNLDNASIEMADEVNKTYVTPEELRLLTGIKAWLFFVFPSKTTCKL